MAIFKCKMCGGNLEVSEGMTVCECEYCGTKQTLPKSADEQQLNLINRANHFRQQCDFDKAMEIYERILQRDDSDAEIYWSIVLCKYGIEYVDDPATGKKIPTCHRAQYTLITQDADYLEVLSHADVVQKEVYQSEAEYIANVQKGILEISNKEEPFDVFICYKETGEDGKRTQDSVLAQDLYYQLTQEGFKVFFSRITLEDKLGSAYEPYIFAALNSSKVMVVVGTKPEYFNAVWVKNEWNRFLMLMKTDRSKTLIPAYKAMDPYDLPDALSMFQAQDMSKLGFMQDLTRGIRKIITVDVTDASTSSPDSNYTQPTGSMAPLLQRIEMFLEDGDWNRANEYCEKVLDIEPKNSEAYLYQFLAVNKVNSIEALFVSEIIFEDTVEYKRALRYANNTTSEKLVLLKNNTHYNRAVKAFEQMNYVTAIMEFELLGDFKDSADWLEKSRQADINSRLALGDKAFSEERFMDAYSIFSELIGNQEAETKAALAQEMQKKNEMLDNARKLVENRNLNDLQECIKIIDQIGDYKDSRNIRDRALNTIVNIERENQRKAELEQARQQLDELKERRREILKLFNTLSIFDGHKKKELQAELNDISREERSIKKLYDIE